MIINFWRYDRKITAKMAIVYVNNQTDISPSKCTPKSHCEEPAVEHETLNLRVVGSSPASGEIISLLLDE